MVSVALADGVNGYWEEALLYWQFQAFENGGFREAQEVQLLLAHGMQLPMTQMDKLIVQEQAGRRRTANSCPALHIARAITTAITIEYNFTT